MIVLLLILLSIPASLILATLLRLHGSAAADDLRCPHCGYPRTGLNTAALCPECGSPPNPSTPSPAVPGPRLGRAVHGLFPAAILPASVAFAYMWAVGKGVGSPGLFFWGTAAWALAALCPALIITIVRPAIRRAHTIILAAALLLPFETILLLAISHITLVFAGARPAGEYGLGFDITVTGLTLGPFAASCIALWIFCLPAAVLLSTEYPPTAKNRP